MIRIGKQNSTTTKTDMKADIDTVVAIVCDKLVANINASICTVPGSHSGHSVLVFMRFISKKYSRRHKACIISANARKAQSFHSNPVSIIATKTIALPVRVRNVGICNGII
jgi:hypothetical protein